MCPWIRSVLVRTLICATIKESEMPQINQLSLSDQPSPGDQIPIYSVNNGDARRLSLFSLLRFFQQTFASPSVSTNVFTPEPGFNITVPTPISAQQWILIQPGGPLASGTLTLPLNSLTPDGSEVLVTTTQQINNFNIGLNGAIGVFGNNLSVMTAGDFFRLRYVASTNSWYQIA